MSVEESIVIFGPSARSDGRGVAHRHRRELGRGTSPNGPPLRSAALWPRPPGGRRQGTGVSHSARSRLDELGPAHERARLTTGAPATSDSLFARARRRPCRSAATVTPRPANPTTALRTTSAVSTSEGSAPGPERSSMPAGSSSASFFSNALSAIATTSGRNSSAWPPRRRPIEPPERADDKTVRADRSTSRSGCRSNRSNLRRQPSAGVVSTRGAVDWTSLGCPRSRSSDVSQANEVIGRREDDRSASIRSSIPPWPGRSDPMSFNRGRA